MRDFVVVNALDDITGSWYGHFGHWSLCGGFMHTIVVERTSEFETNDALTVAGLQVSA